MKWRDANETLKVGVLSHLEEDIIIGTDYTDFFTLLTKAGQEHTLKTWWEEVPFGAGEGVSRTPKITLSKREKRVQRQHYTQKNNTPPEPSSRVASRVCTIPGEFWQSQRDDPSLKNAWQQALNPEERAVGSRFQIQNHLLYRIPNSEEG
ncbi:hypothetical protein NDU88_001326 [Pleurodeles waltl]|uniref:Uncharacterized protein n=1 Tax=Pleurodeles waltl TaxID=8319 RepID=A0AAV7TJR7_PLEWA|nr:hypothetical protein NDU88_001326 [Pleurodeles waltl]